MKNPATALGWELWRRHRAGIVTVLGLLLAFAVVYPRLCEVAEFKTDASSAEDEIARVWKSTPGWQVRDVATIWKAARMLGVFFLGYAPTVAMVLSFTFVTWVFTFTDYNPRAKHPFSFPTRVFALPIRTRYLSSGLLLWGAAALALLSAGWVLLVPLPRVELWGQFPAWYVWVALLAVAQAAAWGLSAFPGFQTLVLTAMLFGFLYAAAWGKGLASPVVLPVVSFLIVAGAALADCGMRNMRHGEWQGWKFRRLLELLASCLDRRPPERFKSAARAQLWFEWRHSARSWFFTSAGCVGSTAVLFLVVRAFGGQASWEGASLFLWGIPLVLYFLVSLSPGGGADSTYWTRPLTNGGLAYAKLRAGALSIVLSAVVSGLAWFGIRACGDVSSITATPAHWLAVILLSVFLTWRFFAVNLCFGISNNGFLGIVPILGPCLLAVANVFVPSSLWDTLRPMLTEILLVLLVLKFTLAFAVFRIALARRLLTPSSVRGYLAVWLALVVAVVPLVLVTGGLLARSVLATVLVAVLAVPLARVAVCPITLELARHR